jgi:hypothetical protein
MARKKSNSGAETQEHAAKKLAQRYNQASNKIDALTDDIASLQAVMRKIEAELCEAFLGFTAGDTVRFNAEYFVDRSVEFSEINLDSEGMWSKPRAVFSVKLAESLLPGWCWRDLDDPEIEVALSSGDPDNYLYNVPTVRLTVKPSQVKRYFVKEN